MFQFTEVQINTKRKVLILKKSLGTMCHENISSNSSIVSENNVDMQCVSSEVYIECMPRLNPNNNPIQF